MRILSLEDEPIARLPYVNAASGGGRVSAVLPILAGTVDVLPAGISALLVASDLQGVVREADGTVLLGQALAEALPGLADAGHLPDPGEVGALLCGDLYAAPGGDVRGATGDVRAVWEAFAAGCRWVSGVAGNHDLFDGEKVAARALSRPGAERWDRGAVRHGARRFAARPGMHLLDGQVVELDRLRIGGVSGIIGNTRKPNRREGSEFLALLAQVLEAAPQVLMLHQGPDGPGPGQRGEPEVRELIEAAGCAPLVLCGHCHWNEPLALLDGGVQVLNADARVVVLRAG